MIKLKIKVEKSIYFFHFLIVCIYISHNYKANETIDSGTQNLAKKKV